MDRYNTHDRLAICTVTTRSHLGFARCLMDSFFHTHPESAGYVLYLGDVVNSDEICDAAVYSIRPQELRVPDLDSMLGRYNNFEMCNALKPFLLQHLFTHTEHKKLCYFDSDIFIFASL